MKFLHRKNRLWEGSRMFLPEHREQLLQHRETEEAFTLPDLSEEQLLEMNHLIYEAVEGESPLLFFFVKEKQPQQMCGFVEKINPYERWIRIINGRIICTIPFDGLYRVEEV